jgi:methyl-accepting chemotaxis protein
MVAENSTKVGAIVDDIALTSNQQNNGIEKVNKAAMEMDNVIRENSENAKGSASASEEMDRQACQMRDFVQDLVSLTAGAKSA